RLVRNDVLSCRVSPAVTPGTPSIFPRGHACRARRRSPFRPEYPGSGTETPRTPRRWVARRVPGGRGEDGPVSETKNADRAGTVRAALRLGVVEGDGIGPEVVRSARKVVDEAMAAAGGAPIDWVPAAIGHQAIAEFGEPLPRRTIDLLAGTDAWLLGPHDNVSYPAEFRQGPPPGGAIRKHFDLYANIR